MKLSFTALVLALLPACGGGEEATQMQFIEAVCARRDVCNMTKVQEQCAKSFKTGCPDGQTWDARAAYRCVQMIAQADCTLVSQRVPQVPESCPPSCH